jgi:hypothetical protein
LHKAKDQFRKGHTARRKILKTDKRSISGNFNIDVISPRLAAYGSDAKRQTEKNKIRQDTHSTDPICFLSLRPQLVALASIR